MASIQDVTSVGAGATNKNVLEGSVYETAPWPARLEFGLVGDAAGELRITVITGSTTILEESPISRLAAHPKYPDDFNLVDVVDRGEKIIVRARNTGVAANNLFWAVRLTPIVG